MKRSCHALASATIIAVGLYAPHAFAQQQEQLLIRPSLPDDFDRGRNESVTERPRPDYDPLGIDVGSFNVRPRVNLTAAYDSNIYLTQNNTVDDAYGIVNPIVTAISNWSRHSLTVTGSTALRRYLDEPARNETTWNFGTVGRYDVNEAINVTGEVQIAKLAENLQTGAVDAQVAAFSRYRRDFYNLRGEYRAGQARFLVAVDNTVFRFSDLTLLDKTRVDQGDRDRTMKRITGQAEYAFTPSVSIFGQGAYDWIDYREPLRTGADNRDSQAFRFSGGFNFDLAGLARGTLAVGYVHRNFRSAIYPTVSGLSAAARIEYFASPLTTVTLQVKRDLQDANIGNGSTYFDTVASIGVDHELLRNLILSAVGELQYQDYVDSPIDSTLYRVFGGGRYLVNNMFSIGANLQYLHRDSKLGLVNGFNEFRGQVTLTIQR